MDEHILLKNNHILIYFGDVNLNEDPVGLATTSEQLIFLKENFYGKVYFNTILDNNILSQNVDQIDLATASVNL